MRLNPNRWMPPLALALLLSSAFPLLLSGQGGGGAVDFVAVARDGVVMHSTDQGATWSAASPANAYINGVVSDNRGRFVAVGAKGTILLSRDGKGWESVGPGLDAETILNAVAWDDRGRFITVGSNGSIFYSDDGGGTWLPGHSGVTETLLSLATDREGTWVVGGPQGLILRSADGGESWSRGTLGEGIHVNDLEALGEGRWVAVGLKGKAAFSSDGGLSWAISSTGVTVPLEGVGADDSGRIVAVGWNGSVVWTEDQGATWAVAESGTTRRLAGITADTDGHFVAVGWSGTVLRSSDGGVNWESAPQATREVLQEVAYNRRPDLTVTSFGLDTECRVRAEFLNTAPATIPEEVWSEDEPMVRLLRNDSLWSEISMSVLDPDQALRPGGSGLPFTFLESVGDSVQVTVSVDPDGRVVESREGNNALGRWLVCEGGREGSRPGSG